MKIILWNYFSLARISKGWEGTGGYRKKKGRKKDPVPSPAPLALDTILCYRNEIDEKNCIQGRAGSGGDVVLSCLWLGNCFLFTFHILLEAIS